MESTHQLVSQPKWHCTNQQQLGVWGNVLHDSSTGTCVAKGVECYSETSIALAAPVAVKAWHPPRVHLYLQARSSARVLVKQVLLLADLARHAVKNRDLY